MSGLWSRGEYQGWPTKWPVSSLGALLIAVAVGIGIFTYRNAVLWTPLQRWYWDQYLSAQLMPMKANSPNSNYRLLAKLDRHGKQQLALDADVVPGPRQGRQLIPFTLSSQARQAGGWRTLSLIDKLWVAHPLRVSKGWAFPTLALMAFGYLVQLTTTPTA